LQCGRKEFEEFKEFEKFKEAPLRHFAFVRR
jgi:hypothetical protein